ncbi:glycoside hydrolase family 3 N-terminal domain-containing protein [Sphingomonas sp. LB3N6]|uniref:glycoside hydrolase family 3 protein n=1 Tax=Sphingomonas fucosidasi TaxID=3096164 RepID=UPI002FCC4A07
MTRYFLLLAAAMPLLIGAAPVPEPQPAIGHRAKPVLRVDGRDFHDSDGDGRLSPYEDWRLSPERRADDLVARMTLAEKAGLLMHGTPPGIDKGLRAPWDLSAMKPLIRDRHIRYFIHRVTAAPAALAEMANAAQEMAEGSRLGIPIVFSSDPRNTQENTFGLSVAAGRFSQWPEPTGLAAIGDAALVRRFATTAAREYRAVGIRMALSPMADLASEPRWPRISGTFGDDPDAVGRYAQAYVEGFQGGDHGLGLDSVAAVVKHWVGYGAQPEGYDAHNPYGRRVSLRGDAFAMHVRPFLGAFRSQVAGVMPTYAEPPAGLVVAGRALERVGAGFSRQLLTEQLRDRYRFGGVVLTDWKITDDCDRVCVDGTLDIDRVGMPWGVEGLTKDQRFAKALDAGVDQFGGVMDVDIVVRLVGSGRIAPDRIDRSARRLLTQIFALGLFENAYVDPADAERTVGDPAARAAAQDAQRRSLVLLRNTGGLLPLASASRKVWLWKVSPEVARAHGFTVVERPQDADLAIVRIAAPFTQHTNYFFGARHHEGSLAFPPDNADRLAIERATAALIPLVVSAYLDRPAILTDIQPGMTALLADFGVGDGPLLDVLLGHGRPEGRLPFELPASMAAVERQRPDLPSDTGRPLYARGYGLRYAPKTTR